MRQRLLLPILLVLAVTIVACAAPPELLNESFLQDTSLIDGEPCGPPCWNGITPGETSWRDTVTQLEDDPNAIDIQTESDEETGAQALSWQPQDGVPCCIVFSSDGETVDQLLLQLAPQMTTAEVFEAHGEPSFVTLSEFSADQASAALYYPDIQTIVYVFIEGVEGAITPESPVFAVLYATEDDIDEAISLSELYVWDGYASYADYAEREFDITPEPTVEGGEGEPTDADETDDETNTEEDNG